MSMGLRKYAAYLQRIFASGGIYNGMAYGQTYN